MVHILNNDTFDKTWNNDTFQKNHLTTAVYKETSQQTNVVLQTFVMDFTGNCRQIKHSKVVLRKFWSGFRKILVDNLKIDSRLVTNNGTISCVDIFPKELIRLTFTVHTSKERIYSRLLKMVEYGLIKISTSAGTYKAYSVNHIDLKETAEHGSRNPGRVATLFIIGAVTLVVVCVNVLLCHLATKGRYRSFRRGSITSRPSVSYSIAEVMQTSQKRKSEQDKLNLLNNQATLERRGGKRESTANKEDNEIRAWMDELDHRGSIRKGSYKFRKETRLWFNCVDNALI